VGEAYPAKVGPGDVVRMLGQEQFENDSYENNDYAGVVTGLAWTPVGGDILFIETLLNKGKGQLTLSGQLGDVMKESAVAALSFLKAHAADYGIDYRIFDQYNLHIHVPAGAVPKDGPSAGITMLTAIASALTQRRVKSNLAMTGEITLRGKVLPVGGIKEKILAAKRAGIKEIIMCVKNRKDGKVMRYAINSNLVPKDDIMDRLIELSHYVPHLEVYTSCEAFGSHAEYIRDGFVWSKWIANLTRLHTEGNIKKTHMMMTINSLCLASITEFMDEMMAFKKTHDTVYPTMSLNILRFPSFQSCAMLPTEIRQKYKDKLQVWLDEQIAMDLRTSDGKQMLMSIEREQTQRLIDYLDVVKTPHKNVKDIEQNRRDFKQFYAQYDVRRDKSFRDTFPAEFVAFYDGIQTDLPTADEIITQNYRAGVDLIPDHPPEDPSKDVFVNPDLQ
jgi:hypothetical protein